MAVGAAALGDKGQNLGFVQLNGLAGGQLIADQNYRPLQFQPALGPAGKNAQNAAAHVQNVVAAGLHIGIVHLPEHPCELLGGFVHGGLGGQPIQPDGTLNGVLKIQVFGQQLVGFKQVGGLLAALPQRTARQAGQLQGSAGLGRLEARPFSAGVLGGVRVHRRRRAPEQVQRAAGNACAGPVALDGGHKSRLPSAKS